MSGILVIYGSGEHHSSAWQGTKTSMTPGQIKVPSQQTEMIIKMQMQSCKHYNLHVDSDLYQ